MPFLERVLAGRNVPRERMLEVAHHYELFEGVSPINAQNRALIGALRAELGAHGIDWPIYLGNRNWHPLLVDTLREMAGDGVKHALALLTSPYSSYSSCRQYRQNIADARAQVPGAPRVSQLRKFFNHPGFIEPSAVNLRAAIEQVPPARRARVRVAFTAHSIPQDMARTSMYEAQLEEACRLVAGAAGAANWALVYQSRSGSPSQPWLGPDICDHLRSLAGAGAGDVVVMPIGFISDHMEVLYDLDHEAAAVANELGLNMVRAATVGTHPRFVAMIRELIAERLSPGAERLALGCLGLAPDACPGNCCQPPEARGQSLSEASSEDEFPPHRAAAAIG
jgi:ferrochelatase